MAVKFIRYKHWCWETHSRSQNCFSFKRKKLFFQSFKLVGLNELQMLEICNYTIVLHETTNVRRFYYAINQVSSPFQLINHCFETCNSLIIDIQQQLLLLFNLIYVRISCFLLSKSKSIFMIISSTWNWLHSNDSIRNYWSQTQIFHLNVIEGK